MIRVFPRRTKWTPDDDLAFIGDPPLFRPPEQPVYVSCTFTWDKPEAERLGYAWSQYYRDVRVGGPAFDDPGGEFVSGRFVKEGVTITSRGCCHRCPWCWVPDREGNIRTYPIYPGWIVQDNNLLACPKEHILAVFKMLRTQKKAISFNGGLDTRFLRHWHVDELKMLNISEIWVACDDWRSMVWLDEAAHLLSDFPTAKKRCYVMIGFNGERLVDAEKRLEEVYLRGFLPFCQLYRGPSVKSYSQDWIKLNKKWSRPAAYRSKGPGRE